MNYIKLGENIRRYRKTANMTQRELAEKIDKSDSYIGEIERATGIPSLETVVDIANCLNVTVDQLVVGSVEQPEKIYLREIASRIDKYPLARRILACEAISSYLDSLEAFGGVK